MKQLKSFITGILALSTFIMLAGTAHANICGPKERGSQQEKDSVYKKIYCEMKLDENEKNDEKLVEILSAQFSMDENIIEAILADTICTTAKKFDDKEKEDLPEAVKNACLPLGNSTEDVLGGWGIFSDIKSAYEKERSMKLSSASLEFKFQVSEQYWDGRLANSPFDLIVDLNLIEIILFGSQAQWLNDVYVFPTKEGEDDDKEVPLDDLLAEEGDREGDGPDATEDPGFTVETEEGDRRLPNCVSPDDPDADTGDGPGSYYENQLCGNGKLDVLLAEQCDDGNRRSGDGCNQFCQQELGGSGEQCQDPEAINFQSPGSISDGGGSDSNGRTGGESDGGGEDVCPPGTVPRKSTGISGTEAGRPQEVPQAFEYPGPFVGGTLKQFPESNRPPCGPGETNIRPQEGGLERLSEVLGVDITIAGGIEKVGKVFGTDITIDGPICVPTALLCTSPNDARDFLFGDDWSSDPELEKIALAITATFCVNITKANRPLSPYSLNEGCIDCHITAMVDSLEKALATNVTPLANTTSAFAISSKFGPNFSFNLSTAIKGMIRYQETRTIVDALPDKQSKKSEDDNEQGELSINSPESNLDQLIRDEALLGKELKDNLEDTRMRSLSSDVISDQEFDARVKPLLIQMKESFVRIQSGWQKSVESTDLDKRAQCIP